MAVFPDRIVLKNSTDDKATIEAAIASGGTDPIVQGELVLALSDGSFTLYSIDENGAVVAMDPTALGGKAIVSDTPPTVDPNGNALSDGQLWFNPTDGTLHVWYDLAWVEVSSSGGGDGGGGRIQDAEDFSLIQKNTDFVVKFIATQTTLPGAGEVEVFGTSLFSSTIDLFGTDFEPVLTHDENDLYPAVISVNGSEVYRGDLQCSAPFTASRIAMTTPDSVAWQGDLVDGDELTFSCSIFGTTDIPLSQGDILRWNEETETFQPINYDQILGYSLDSYGYGVQKTKLATGTGNSTVSGQPGSWAWVTANDYSSLRLQYRQATVGPGAIAHNIGSGGNTTNIPVYLSGDGINWTRHTITSTSASSSSSTWFGITPDLKHLRNATELYFTREAPIEKALSDGAVAEWSSTTNAWAPSNNHGKIQNMKDYGADPVVTELTWLFNASGGSVVDEGYCRYWTGTSLTFFSGIDADGISVWESLTNGGLETVPCTILVNDVEVHTGTLGNFSNFSVPNKTAGAEFDDYAWLSGVATDDRVTVRCATWGSSPGVPADGDVLQWSDSSQAFVPAQVSGGGGGGAVDSVNGQTGVVSLGVQDMDDFELQAFGDYTGLTEGVGAVADVDTTTKWLVSSSSFYAVPDTWNSSFVVGDTMTIQRSDSVDSFTYTIDQIVPNFNSTTATRFLFLETTDTSLRYSSNGNYSGGITVSSPRLSSTFVPLAEGDVLQWDAADDKFKPAPLNVVTSVNDKTGAVSLGIRDMDDYGLAANALNKLEFSIITSTDTADLVSGVASASYYSPEIYLRMANDDIHGTDTQSWITSVSSQIWVTINGSNPAEHTIYGYYNAGTYQQALLRFGPDFTVGLEDGDIITIYENDPTSTPGAVLVDGDMLTWDATGSQFQPSNDFISKTTLKAEVAASTDFADFQTRIAAL